MKVLRVCHAAADPSQREREREMSAFGLDVTLVVPTEWRGSRQRPRHERGKFTTVALPIDRSGDVNRHRYASEGALVGLIDQLGPDLLDIHEEPFGRAAQQWIAAAPEDLPIVVYTAQNIDKRYPPPFALYERRAHMRAAALYPCSRQAASVARGKGFNGLIDVMPLGFDPELFRPGHQSLKDNELVLALCGRLVPEKGARDAVRVLASVNRARPARLIMVGSGPEERPARELAAALGVRDQLEVEPWQPADELGRVLRRTHVVLVPSVSTATWTEQFGRVIVEAQASGAVVAGYRSGAIPEVAGPPALLVAEQDVTALARELIDLLCNPTEFTNRREQGIARNATRTWETVAKQHAELYRRVLAGEFEPVRLPRSPRKRRALAREEFGGTAKTPAGRRPFALPPLRGGGAVPRALAGLIDASAESAAFLRSLRGAHTDQKSAS